MKYFLVVLPLLLFLGSSSAQNFISKVYLPSSPVKRVSTSAQADTLKILAVMAEFQADRDGTTFGNGKFGSIYSKDYGNNILDPLPHDKFYFESHLLFAKNYFQKVSKGKIVIQYTVLPKVVTVSKTMRNYSPPSNSNDFTLLANFVKEVWHLVDSTNPGFDFSKYNVFTIFHAGAGRDITLPGTLGNEHNIPSLYLGENLFKKIYGNSFDGFPVQNNTFKIANTIVMPETENREVSNGLTTSFLQLTINGLMTANIGSYLGMPDLFNTKTGESAIGRFGLMDGQSFFAYGGLFPPQPSAWEKIYMGWAKPVTITPGNYKNIKLVADLAASLPDTVILKVPISSKEYFLVENRNRDVYKDGETVTYISNGITSQKTFKADSSNFNSFDVSAISGVVTDADEYDWALPGSGIVIWHIDENVINDNLASNSINAGTIKGVYVEEADGIQDIGQKFTDIFGDEIIGEGTQDDFWYKSNPSKFFKNKFGKDTRPNTNSNKGANSLITISNFSDIANSMTFDIAYGDSIIKNIFYVPTTISAQTKNLSVLQDGNNFQFGLVADSGLYFFNQQGSLTGSVPGFSVYKPATLSSGGYTYYIGAKNNFLNFYIMQGAVLKLSTGIDVGSAVTAPPVIRSLQPGKYQVLAGTASGKIYIYSLTDPVPGNPALTDSLNFGVSPIKMLAVNGSYVTAISGNSFFDSNGKTVLLEKAADHIALTKDNDGNYLSVVSAQNKFYIIKNGTVLDEFSPGMGSGSINGFAVADLKNDGQNYIIFTSGDKIEARNISGALADNFSFTDPLGYNFTGTPLAGDFEGDSRSEIIASTTDGRIFAIDGGTGKIINGFPLTAGNSLPCTPVLFENGGKFSLAAVNSDNYFSAWAIGASSGKFFWSSENGNDLNSAFVNGASQNNYITEFFPLNRAYNYPNPVYGNTTNIRYYVSEDSKIDIKIFDIAGSFVDELKDFAPAGLDHETVWNVAKVQSGIYLARIQATGSSGKSESKIIKIAVVK